MSKTQLKKVYIYIFSVVVAFFIAFYFLAGDQLKYRDSRFQIVALEGNTSTKELVVGRSVTQTFFNNVERLKSISFEVTDFYRETNKGSLRVQLLDGGELVKEIKYDISKFSDSEYIEFDLGDYREDLYGKELTLYFTSNSLEGYGIGLLRNNGSTNGVHLLDNLDYKPGSLSFNTYGQENIFTGKYYWQMVLGICAVVGLMLIVSYNRFINKKADYLSIAVSAVERYKFLISQLVIRDFKIKYKRSVLGIFWSFLNPLLTMLVQYIVFSTMFRSEIDKYAVYLLVGIVCYSFFNEVTTMSLQSISGNANLIKKVYMPKYILPLARTLSSSVNLLISIIPLLLISVLTGVVFHKSIFLTIFFLLCLIVFALGVGMFLSALNVFFRDVQFLWTVVCMMWMYATPIFYSPSIIPEKFGFVLDMNPLYHFIKNIRMCIIEGISPGPKSYLFCFLFAMLSLALGSFVFKKSQDKFTLYL